MATLENTQPKNTFKGLLKTADATATLSTTEVAIETGNGVTTALKLSTDTVEVAGALKFESSNQPSNDGSELTALLVNDSGVVVSRELDSGAFSSTSVNKFQTISVSTQSDVVADVSNDTLTLVAGTGIALTTDAGAQSVTIAQSGITVPPFMSLRPSAAYDMTSSFATVTQASISNTSATGSYEVDPDGVLALSSNKVVVGSAGIVKIDVNFFVNSSGGADNDISITLNQTVESSDSVIQEVVRRKDATGLTAISFSYIQYVAANTSLFYQIKRGSAASLLTTSTFTVTKLT